MITYRSSPLQIQKTLLSGPGFLELVELAICCAGSCIYSFLPQAAATSFQHVNPPNGKNARIEQTLLSTWSQKFINRPYRILSNLHFSAVAYTSVLCKFCIYLQVFKCKAYFKTGLNWGCLGIIQNAPTLQ